MTTRRDFLQMALTAPLLPSSLRVPPPDGRTDSLVAHARPGSLYTVLCDERFAESVAFAEEMSRRGTPVTRFRGDVSDFKIANRYRVPLFAVSTGKNLGYGGSAGNLSGMAIVDLKRMNRVIEVDDERYFAIVEPVSPTSICIDTFKTGS